jgi:fluoride ion exporter CrcB/FEX
MVMSAQHTIGPMAWMAVALGGALGSMARHGVVFVALLGGFTTFSTFGLDTFLLGRTDSAGQAVVNVAVQVIGGLVAVWLGYLAGAGRSV